MEITILSVLINSRKYDNSTILTMTTKLVEVKRQWEQLVFAYRFMQLVKAADGDMESIGRLAKRMF